MSQHPLFSRTGLPISPDLRALIVEQFGGEIVERPWLCDVKAANAAVIQAHNRVSELRGEPVEAKFASVQPVTGRLPDLLWSDYAHLCRGVPALAADSRLFEFFEIHGPNPRAGILSVETDSGTLHAIGFRAALLHFLHAAFSKTCLLSAHARHADCLEEHDHILEREEYSDTHLLAGFYNDIEMLFDRERLHVPIFPEHWADPYDYCGRVEAARRFILSHEVGHAYWPQREKLAIVQPRASQWMSEVRALKWSEEMWCDAFAIHSLLAVFGDEPLDGDRLYDAEDIVMGVLCLTTIMDLVELVLAQHLGSAEHPPFSIREAELRAAIKAHPLYASSPDFQSSVQRVWRRLKVFSRYVGGIGTPDRNGDLWSAEEFQSRLSPFGKSAHATISKRSHDELAGRMASAESLYKKNRRAIERGFMPNPLDIPRFSDEF